jgi:CBS domain-containing protein
MPDRRATPPAVVSDLMTRDVATCAPEATLFDAAKIMWLRDCGFVPVTDDAGVLRGVLTDRDACMAAYTRGLALDQIRVATAMSSDVAVVHEGDSLVRAHELMRGRQVRRLPVIDARHRVVGVLSINDVALHARLHEREERDVAETLSAVCSHRVLVTP